MVATDPMTAESRQFSIRLPRPLWIGAAMVVLIVISVGLRIAVPIYQQELAIREVERAGGSVPAVVWTGPKFLKMWTYHGRPGMFWEACLVNLPNDTNDRKLQQLMPYLRALKSLGGVSIDNSAVSNDGLALLAELRGLEYITLDSTPITDRGLANLKALDKLKMISLANTAVTDEGVSEFKQAVPGAIVNR
jgi:internalin A